jgi:integrase
LSIEALNERLKKECIPVRVRRHGDALCLRATLPPKPGSGHLEPRRYDLSPGVGASTDGLRRIEQEARALGAAIALGRFRWEDWLKPKPLQSEMTIGQWVSRFKAEYMATHDLSEATWQRHWQAVYKCLPQESLLTAERLLEVVFATEANKRHRKETCKKLQALAKFAKLELDILKYQGNYASTNPQIEREPPSDAAIVLWRDKIPTASWQWFFGVCAVFGLRPHEAFFCEFEHPHKLRVLEGKTGPRTVRAFYPEWSDRWELTNKLVPNIHCTDYRGYGDRACRQFNRYKLPFTPYDLRHRYAMRLSIDFRLQVPIAAKEMGHSPVVHWNTYQRWISGAEQDKVYAEVMERPDRPQAP